MIGTATRLVAGILRALADGLEADAEAAPAQPPVPLVLHVEHLTVQAGPEPTPSLTARARAVAGLTRRP